MTTRPHKTPTAILISGRGSNMQAVVAAADDPAHPAQVVSVISNTPDAAGVAWAHERGLETPVVDHREFRGDRARFDRALDTAIRESGAEFVVLAGFMRLLTPEFVTSWSGRMVNIHPSLLPAFKGLDTHARCLAAGIRISGCTVHFVVPEMDAGPIIAQAAVPVLQGDTENDLADRILAAEHQIYPPAIAAVLSSDCALDGEEVVWKKGRSFQTPVPMFSPHIL
ncbi:MAG: phosphoribosylglycinamide formyltransferase [Pseudomonadota bacterium]